MKASQLVERRKYNYKTGHGTSGQASVVQVYVDGGNRTRVVMFDKTRNTDVTVFPSQVWAIPPVKRVKK